MNSLPEAHSAYFRSASMLSVEAARNALLDSITVLPVEHVEVELAWGRFLSATVHAPFPHPRFTQSAVDGYCFAWNPSVDRWQVVGTAAAGDASRHPLGPDECMRIFTGAALPPGADTVVMQEFVQRQEGWIRHSDAKLKPGANVRHEGEQFKVGEPLLQPGARIDPVAIGLLRSAGVSQLAVHCRPRIAVVVTGNEFCTPDAPQPGRVFSSNGEMLQAALRAEGAMATLLHAPDDRTALCHVLSHALEGHELVITTGGVSVGELDLVRPALEELGTQVVFHKVAQKPGKPMLLGTWKDRLVMGLPGNPRAVMILYWMYVLPALRGMQGAPAPFLRTEQLPLADGLAYKGGRTEFRAAVVRNGQVKLLRDEGSHMLSSLLQAEALAEVPAAPGELRQGSEIRVHFLPPR